ncbi:Uncharacterised protein [Neisseria meningitidis]|nr:Uncharacterised protein [Neisseria meningitidis]
MKCGLDGGFIGNDLCLLAQFRRVEVRLVRSPSKNRQGNRRRKRPNAGAAFEQPAQFGRTRTDASGQADGWEKGGACRTDIGVCLFERVFGGAYVGTVEQYFGTQTGRQFFNKKLLVQRQTGRQVFGYRLVNQGCQGIARLFAAARGMGIIGFGRFDQGFLLT